jgi:hypothetical protein
MQSLREQLIQAVVTSLTPVAAAQGATLRRQPTIPTDRAHSPALLVCPEAETVRRVNERCERELTLRLVAVSFGTETETPEPIADRLLTAAHLALFADVTLGGLALGIKELDCDWQQDDADMEAAAIPARYQLTYRTLVSDISQKG